MPTRLNNNHSVRVTYHKSPLSMTQTFDRHIQYCSTSRANQSLRSLANAGFQNRGVCLQAFPSFPSPSPLFHFLALISFLARPKPVFLCSETKWKRLLRRLSKRMKSQILEREIHFAGLCGSENL